MGSLIYLTVSTRPDLSFIVSNLSQHFAKNTEQQYGEMRHVLMYLVNMSNKGIVLQKKQGVGHIVTQIGPQLLKTGKVQLVIGK